MKLQKSNTDTKEFLQLSFQATKCCFACAQSSGMSRVCTAQALSWIRAKFLCCTNWGRRATETSRHDYTHVTGIIEDQYCIKEEINKKNPACTPVLALPNSRDGPTTATSPWCGLFPGVGFSLVWASFLAAQSGHGRCTQGLSILRTAHQRGSTAVAPKGEWKRLLLSN